MNSRTIQSLICGLIVCAILYFDTRFFSTFDLAKAVCVYAFVLMIFFFWWLDGCKVRPYVKDNPLLAVSVFCFVAVNFVAMINAVNPWISFKGAFLRYTGFGFMIACLFVFTMIVTYFKREHLKYLINSIVWSGVATIPYGVAQYYGLDPYASLGWSTVFGHRVFSTFGNPVFFGAFLSIVIPLVVYKTSQCKWYALLIPAFLACLYFTKCRAGFVAVVVSSGYIIFMQRESFFKNKNLMWGVVIVFLMFVGVNFASNENLSMYKKFTTLKTDPRTTEIWPTGLKIARAYPVLGVGQDNIRSVWCKYLVSSVFPYTCSMPTVIDGATEWDAAIQHEPLLNCQAMSHQDLIDRVCETGLIGLAFYLFMLYAFFKMTWRKDMLTTCLSASVLAYVAQNQFSFGTVPLILLWWVLMAMTFVACKPQTAKELNDKLKFLKNSGRNIS